MGQVQGHKQVATHMRGSSHIIKALTPVSPASQGAEAIVQSPAWGLLAQCSVALGHSLALQASLSPARRRGIRLERANAASDSIRQPREQLPGQATGAKPRRPLPSPSPSREAAPQSRKGKICSKTGCQADSPAGGSEGAGSHPRSHSIALWALRDAEAMVGCREHPGRIPLPPWQQVLPRTTLATGSSPLP